MTDDLEVTEVSPERTRTAVAVTAILFAGPIGGAIVGLILATRGDGQIWTLLLSPWFALVGAVLGAIVAGVAVLVLRRLSRAKRDTPTG